MTGVPAATGPLSGMRVVDLTDLRGALCARILADLGADVVKVLTSRADESAHAQTVRRYRDANKTGVRLDPVAAHDRAQLAELLTNADVLVENLDFDARVQAGLLPEQVAAAHPRLVHVALADFGLSGRRARWRLEPLTALAASGTLHASGFPDLEPCAAPGHLAHDCASVYGAIGAVAAAMDRRRGGRGQLVEISVQEAALAGTTPWSICMEDYSRVNPHLPTAGNRNADGSYWVLPAQDGWVRTVIGSPRQWNGFVNLVHDNEALKEPEWASAAFRLMNADAVRLLAAEGLTDRTRKELFDEALGLETTVGVLHRPSEFAAHPQTASRGFFAATDFPGLEGAPFATFPMKLSATPPALRRPAPETGPDAEPEAGSVGSFARPSDEPFQGESGGALLLAGVRVIEFGAAAVVPEMSGVLSELGADVVRIESVAHPDVLRASGGGGEANINRSFAFNAENRGRRSVALDLTTAEGRRIAFELCTAADIVAENQRGGVLDRLGLGYEAVRAVNPSVIYASSQGYGRGGPLGEMPAYGPLNAGFAGVHLLWNHPDAPYPCGTSLNHPDHIAGKLMAVAVLAAFDHRERTGGRGAGEGQLIDMSQTEAAAYLVGEIYLQAALDGQDPQPQGNRSDVAVPHGVYPSDGHDRWVAIVARDDAAWIDLERAVGWSHEPALATLAARLAARKAIDARLASFTRERTREETAEILQAAGVSAVPVMGPIDHHADEHLAERAFIVTLEHPEVGRERHAGNPIRMSRLAQRAAASAPCLGADTAAALTEWLELSDDEIAALADAGVTR